MNTLISRQPIFSADDGIAAYSILCQTPGGAAGATDELANTVLVRALLGVGLERIADGKPAFIGVTRDVLLGGTLETLDPSAIVLRLLETVDADTEVVDACSSLAGLGYTIALDRFTHTPRNEALLSSARIVGVDVAGYDAEELTMHVALLRPYGVEFLGQNVHDDAAHALCLQLGFRYFEGHHLATPESVAEQNVGVTRARALRALKLLRDAASKEHDIEEEFRRDPALSYNLLRIVNSAAVGGQGVRSISHAMKLLGRGALERWLSLLLIPQGGDTGVEREKLKASLTRARFCELLADSGSRPLSGGTLFLVGILSALETYYGLAVESIVETLDLAPEVAAALTGRRGPFGATISLVAAHQVGDWDKVLMYCEDLGISEDALTPAYLDSLAWVQERLDDLAVSAQPAAARAS